MIFPPLLTETELQALYQRARSAAADNCLQNLLEQRQASDVASRYRGAGRLNLQGLDGVTHRVNLADSALHEQFHQQATALHDGQAQRLRGWGCHYTQRFTDVDTPELAVLLPHGMGA